MCNALQQRMVEESLVQKEVYDAMMKMRTSLNTAFGQPVPVPKTEDPYADLPPDLAEPSKRSTGYRSLGNQVPSDVLAAGAAEPPRQRAAAKPPLKPYIPPTIPKEDGNPFPGLMGPLG